MNILSLLLCFFMLHSGTPTNLLIFESSPYLQMHSHDIVKWRAWNPASLNEAKSKHLPIFLSIGFSTCHWCHVMERTVFNNPEIAKIINKYFIPIKVDKEEMPNIDNYYMKLYEVMNERKGGWPLTFILTEDLEPIFAGTYIQPFSDEKGDGFDKLLPELVYEYKYERKFIKDEFEEYKRKLLSLNVNQSDIDSFESNFIEMTVKNLKENYDEKYGGFRHLKIKFPATDTLKLLMDIYKINKNEKLKEMVIYSANMMMKSGLYDQIEGAFYRYSTGHDWKIPHFEKMLYTNALLIKLYSDLYGITKNERFKTIVEETIGEINRIYRKNDFLYFSASDAESEFNGRKIEGGYFIYKYEDTLNYLVDKGFGDINSEIFLNQMDITKRGNFVNGYSVSNIFNKSDLKIDFDRGVNLLRNIRKNRKFPFIDKKQIASWNALMSEALMTAEVINENYKNQVIKTLKSILKNFENNGKLKHIKINSEVKIEGYLEDYAYLISSLLYAYQTDFNEIYLKKADILAQKAINKFYNDGMWYSSIEGIKSIENISDRYLTSPATVMVKNLFILSLMTENKKYFKIANDSVRYLKNFAIKSAVLYPSSAMVLLQQKLGSVLIKSSEANLKTLKPLINRPFVYYKKYNVQGYVGCSESVCFISDDDIKNVIKAIEDYKK